MIRMTWQAPREDRTERAMFDVFLAAEEFQIALSETTDQGRVRQLKERLEAVIADLIRAENAAMAKAETLSRMWGAMS